MTRQGQFSVVSGSLSRFTTAAEDTDRKALEELIDEISEQSFPASDPPAWDVARARMSQVRGTRSVTK